MIHLDISILYQVVLFILLWLILSRVVFKPYINLLDERERKTAGAEHDSTDLEQEGARLKSVYETRITQAQTAAYAAKDAIVAEGRQERERILGQARDEAAKHLDQVRREIAAALEQEKRLAENETANIAREMVSKILGRSVA